MQVSLLMANSLEQKKKKRSFDFIQSDIRSFHDFSTINKIYLKDYKYGKCGIISFVTHLS